MGIKATIFTVTASIALMAGCTTTAESIMNDVDPRSWDSSTVISYENSDTLSLRDISIVVRYNADRQCDMLPLTITTAAPDSTVFTEQFVCRLNGQHKPAPTSAVKKIPYRLSSRLANIGTYNITITPTERQRGIEAVGVTFENKE